jgi:hypothetical protein
MKHKVVENLGGAGVSADISLLLAAGVPGIGYA